MYRMSENKPPQRDYDSPDYPLGIDGNFILGGFVADTQYLILGIGHKETTLSYSYETNPIKGRTLLLGEKSFAAVIGFYRSLLLS